MPNGKVVKARVNFSDKIESVSITGDFFLYPEEKFGEIEKVFLGMSAAVDEKKLAEKVQKVITENGIQVFGAKAEDFTKAVIQAIEKGLIEATEGN
ncbi:MAG: hypothetical protein Q7K42_01655 [Candidatus Diapherotrites archaeon]|nr:hypothetical protein [Candidatus Diapherotrites archaeon]